MIADRLEKRFYFFRVIYIISKQIFSQVDEDVYFLVNIQIKNKVREQVYTQVNEIVNNSTITKVRSIVWQQHEHVRDMVLSDQKLYE